MILRDRYSWTSTRNGPSAGQDAGLGTDGPTSVSAAVTAVTQSRHAPRAAHRACGPLSRPPCGRPLLVSLKFGTVSPGGLGFRSPLGIQPTGLLLLRSQQKLPNDRVPEPPLDPRQLFWPV